MATGASIAQNTLLLTLANLAMRGVSMLFQVYLTGQVGAAGIGLLQLIMTVHAFAITVGTSGIRVAAMYLPAEEHGLGRKAGVRQAVLWCLGAGALLSTLVGCIMAACAEPLALYWVKDLQAAASLRLLGLSLPLTCMSSILAGYFTACGQVKKLAAVEIADRIATVALTARFLKMGIPGDLSHACVSIVAGGALASLGSVAVLLGLMCRDLRTCGTESTNLSMGTRLLRLCVPVALNDYLRAGLGTLEQFLIPYGLSRCAGSRTAALADYGTIHGMVFPVLMFASTVLFAVSDLLIPELALCKARNNQPRIRHITETCLHVGLLFSALVAGFLFVTAEPLGYLLYETSAAGRYLRLFAPLIPLLYLDCIVDGMHKGLGQQVYCVRVNTLTSILDVLLLFLLLPRYGIGGYYFSFFITHALNFYLSIRRLLKFSGGLPLLESFLPTAGCICTAAWFTIRYVSVCPRWYSLLYCGGIYLSLAVLLLMLCGSWRKEDSLLLRRMFSGRKQVPRPAHP